MPIAIIKAISSALTARNMPFNVLPSIRSLNELIMGTPGMRNKTQDANAVSKPSSGKILRNAPAIRVAVRDARNMQKWGLNLYLLISCRTNKPAKVARKDTNIALNVPPKK